MAREPESSESKTISDGVRLGLQATRAAVGLHCASGTAESEDSDGRGGLLARHPKCSTQAGPIEAHGPPGRDSAPMNRAFSATKSGSSLRSGAREAAAC